MYAFTFQAKPLGITVTGKGTVIVKKMKRDCTKDPVCIQIGDRVLSVQGKNFANSDWKHVMDYVKTLPLPFQIKFCRKQKKDCDSLCDEQTQDRQEGVQAHCT